MGEACIPFGHVRGISPVPLMLMVKIEAYAIGVSRPVDAVCTQTLASSM